MNNTEHLTSISPGVLVLSLLILAVVAIGLMTQKVPWLSSLRFDIVLVVLPGMMMCAMGGIGRVAAQGAWAHPLSILGYILGGAILLIVLSVFTGWKLPWIAGERQALIAVTSLIGIKMVDAVLHSLLSRG